jgi:hypothetical protein
MNNATGNDSSKAVVLSIITFPPERILAIRHQKNSVMMLVLSTALSRNRLTPIAVTMKVSAFVEVKRVYTMLRFVVPAVVVMDSVVDD